MAVIRDIIEYKSLIKHLEYMEIALQWKFQEQDLLKLDTLLNEHATLWADAYGKFCPKYHYRFHFTDAIRASVLLLEYIV